jgi:hypothetical protein
MDLWSASEPRGNNFKRFKDFYLKPSARIWPWLSYLYHVCLTTDAWDPFLTVVPCRQTRSHGAGGAGILLRIYAFFFGNRVEKGFRFKTSIHWSLLHEYFNITGEHHAVYQTSLHQSFKLRPFFFVDQLSSEYGTSQTVNGRFWPWLSGEDPHFILSCSLFAG